MVKQCPVLVGLALSALLLMAAACVSEVDREEAPTPGATSATPVATSTFTPAPPSTVPATPTATETPIPTPVPRPSPTPALRPTPTPAITEEPAPELVLDVRAPADGSAVSTDAVVVHGIATPGALVHIGGVPADVGSDGRFQAEVKLAPGINTIRVVATDSMDNRETNDLNVTSLALPPQPFLLLVTEPEDQSIVSQKVIRLSGRTGPEAISSVNGVSVSVDELGFFSTTVTLEPGPNIIDVVATDTDGRGLEYGHSCNLSAMSDPIADFTPRPGFASKVGPSVSP